MEQRKESKRHANFYVATTSGFSNRGNNDFYFSETIKLYRCHLSHCHWHSRISPMIRLRIIVEYNLIGYETREFNNSKGGKFREGEEPFGRK
jgi:hypothetical protein